MATLMKYHPRAGYTYMPEARLRMPGAKGGYLVRANSAGYRSEREFVAERRDPSVFRALLFGDSQTAGDGVSNSKRYSDLLEAAVPGVEIYNYAVSGQGPDQQLILFEEQAETERDLVVVGFYIENIRRVTATCKKARSMSGAVEYRPVPYYELHNGSLVLRNVPVPKEAWTEETLPEAFRDHVYAHGQADHIVSRLKEALQKTPIAAPLRRAVKSAAMQFKQGQPLPEYGSPEHPTWRLLQRILEGFSEGGAPVLLVLIPHYHFLSRWADPRPYQERFREFAAATGCHVLDTLPGIRDLPAVERDALWNDDAGHLSASGHQALARMLVPWLERFKRERDHAQAPAEGAHVDP